MPTPDAPRPRAARPMIPAARTPAALAARSLIALAILPSASALAFQPVQSAPPAATVQPALDPLAEPGTYRVAELRLQFANPDPALPSVEELFRIPVNLGVTDQGYVAPRPGLVIVTTDVESLNQEGGVTLGWSAIEAVGAALVRTLTERGFGGLTVSPSARDIGGEFQDLRQGRQDLTLFLGTARVEEVRSERAGPDGQPSINDDTSLSLRIRASSPLQAGDLLRRDLLEDQLFRLNRHPGRRVDAVLRAASTVEPGRVALDYKVAEAKPWVIFSQVSNTGTATTEEFRERFGFVHNQLTGDDDVLAIDYITSGFASTHAVAGSYERPFFFDALRARFYGGYTFFSASDVGLPGSDFSGESWQLGAELVYNAFQFRDLFIDAFIGGRYENIRISNSLIASNGQVEYGVVEGGLRLERTTLFNATRASISLSGYNTNASESDVAELGRPLADQDFTVLRWNAEHSQFIEPLLGPNAPKTLAHEVVGSIRGQAALGSRLTPTFQQTVGGFFTVRGYDEAETVGDTTVVGSVEYRFHLPRALPFLPLGGSGAEGPRGQVLSAAQGLFGQNFRFAPTQDYGYTDWDLILRAFLDWGVVLNSEPLPFETDQTLVGTGIGVEFQFRRNVTVRLDWGFVLSELRDSTGGLLADVGDNRLHFLASIAF